MLKKIKTKLAGALYIAAKKLDWTIPLRSEPVKVKEITLHNLTPIKLRARVVIPERQTEQMGQKNADDWARRHMSRQLGIKLINELSPSIVEKQCKDADEWGDPYTEYRMELEVHVRNE